MILMFGGRVLYVLVNQGTKLFLSYLVFNLFILGTPPPICKINTESNFLIITFQTFAWLLLSQYINLETDSHIKNKYWLLKYIFQLNSTLLAACLFCTLEGAEWTGGFQIKFKSICWIWCSIFLVKDCIKELVL